jgi:hypothetical protein
MTAKNKRTLSIILMAIPSFILIMGGVMKLIDAEPESVMQFLTKVGFGNFIKAIGLTEISIAVLYLFPKTNKIGFLLASCYFSGALAIEISAGAPPFSAIFIALVWISMFLKNREMFMPSATAA